MVVKLGEYIWTFYLKSGSAITFAEIYKKYFSVWILWECSSIYKSSLEEVADPSRKLAAVTKFTK